VTDASHRRYQLLVFDWDGTLEDSIGYITASIRQALIALELPVPETQAIRDTIGISIEAALAQLYPNHDANRLAQAVREQAVTQGSAVPQQLFANVPELLRTLEAKGYWLAVATGKSRRGLNQALQHHQIEDYFIDTMTVDEARSKPHPEMLELLLRKTGLEAQDALMIGDSVHDLNMAANAGVDALAVSSGAQSVATLRRVESVRDCVESVLDLETWLRGDAVP